MRLSSSLKQNLVVPAVVGCICGVLSAVGVAGFLSEYGRNTYAESKWSLQSIIVVQSVATFIVVAGGIVFIFGAGPVLLRWVISQREKGNKA